MAQRILEPGEIETLAQRSIPRFRLPARATLFARRAARLRHLSASSGIELLMLIPITSLVSPSSSSSPAALSGRHLLRRRVCEGFSPKIFW